MAHSAHWHNGAGVREYWKLEDHSQKTIEEAKRELMKRGIFTNGSFGKERPIALLERADRGFLFYEQYEDTELRRFCESRAIEVTTEQAASKADLVIALETADETRTFTLFKLLPELRIHVYTHHFASYHHVHCSNLAPPPVTTASRQLRKEALPLFYDTHSFCFAASLIPPHSIDSNVPKISSTRQISESSFASIRKLHLRLVTYGWLGLTKIVDCDVYLGGQDTAATVEQYCSVKSILDKDPQQEPDTTARLLSILDGMTARVEGKALRRTDIESLIQALDPDNVGVATNIEGSA
ncbi:hypothetical protein LTR27_001402 [Elasticomyces elasticus]|nr:hypothetical protein LTR27_001402 [Elasticomyces elasticus]